MTKRQYDSTYIVFFENLDQNTIWFNLHCLFKNFSAKYKIVWLHCLFWKFWPKNNILQLILSLSKVLSKRQYGSTHTLFCESFDRKRIWFNPYRISKKFWPKQNMVQSILSFSKVLTKRQYGSTHAFFFKCFYQNTILFNRYSLLR